MLEFKRLNYPTEMRENESAQSRTDLHATCRSSNLTHKASAFRRTMGALLASCAFGLAVALGALGASSLVLNTAYAQLAGLATIQGTITDPSGAVIPGAQITATKLDTNKVTTQVSTGAGFFSLAGVEPGLYSIRVTYSGFSTFVQENVRVNALQVLGLNVKLTPGGTDETITVTAEPPAIETTNGTLGQTMENATYQELPLVVGGQPRNPAAFTYLTPGVVSDGQSGQYNGGQSYHDETYLEGLALTSPAVQGDQGSVNRGVSVDAVDQFQVQTSGTSAQYQGQGFSNYTLKSGNNTFHGRLFEYFRNTALDTWGWTPKNQINAVTGKAIKPVERQNEYGGTFGGPIMKNRLFFFFAYDGDHYLKGTNPSLVSVPTRLERTGDFSALAPIYDPTTTTCTNGVCTRQQFSYNGKLNVISPARFSKVAQFYQNFIPLPTDDTVQVNNYLGGFNTGFNYQKISSKVDFDVSSKQRISAVLTWGNRAANPPCCDASGLPVPFTATVGNFQSYWVGLIEDTYAISDHWTNQLKYAISRGGGYSTNPGEGAAYAATASGLSNLPSGQASDAAPRFGFSGTNAPASLGGTANSNNQANSEYGTNYLIFDSMQLVKGRHSMSFGGQYQWLQDNDTSLTGGTYLNLNYSNNETATFTSGTTINTATGASYASFLIGAVDGGSLTDSRQVITTGARYFTFSPYFQDDWRVTDKLTVNLGLRWDIYSPFREVNNRLSFVDPSLTNPITGTRGALNFAGDGTDKCNCRTPVAIWYKNFGPHVGFSYAIDPKTVIRGAFGISYTHAGGVGGRGGGRQGTGQLGYSTSLSIASPNSGITPGLYLSPDAGYSLPSYAQPQQVPAFGTGYTTTAGYTGSPLGVTYADPYLSRRAPYYENFNFGVQRELLSKMVLTANYSGSTGHFLGTSIGHGIYSNQLDPQYFTLGSLLNLTATAANIATVQKAMPGFQLPYANFSPSATIAQALRPFPQYNGWTDVWGDMGFSSYNSMQISISQKPRYGLSYTLNYTWSKLLDNTGTGRTAYGKNTQREWSLSTTDLPQNLAAFGVWQEPFGKGSKSLVNSIIKNYSISAIYKYTAGVPLVPTASSCNQPNSGTCEPSYNPAFTGSARINGNYGNPLYGVATKTPYIDANAFVKPSAYTLGNSPRTYPYALRAPGGDNLDMGLRRVFNLYERLSFTFRADVFNVTNNVRFAAPNMVVGNSAFGLISGTSNSSRDVQFAAQIDF